MLLYLYLIALLPLPTWEYKIKVEGKLDIGNQIAAFLKEIRARVLEQKMRAMGQAKRTEHNQGRNEHKKRIDTDAPDQETMAGNDKMASISEMRNKGEGEVSLLDDMINRGEKRMHLYGKHESEEATERNNVHV